jgi:hypothetical protein
VTPPNIVDRSGVTVADIVGPDGYLVLDREGYARLLGEKSGRL